MTTLEEMEVPRLSDRLRLALGRARLALAASTETGLARADQEALVESLRRDLELVVGYPVTCDGVGYGLGPDMFWSKAEAKARLYRELAEASTSETAALVEDRHVRRAARRTLLRSTDHCQAPKCWYLARFEGDLAGTGWRGTDAEARYYRRVELTAILDIYLAAQPEVR